MDQNTKLLLHFKIHILLPVLVVSIRIVVLIKWTFQRYCFAQASLVCCASVDAVSHYQRGDGLGFPSSKYRVHSSPRSFAKYTIFQKSCRADLSLDNSADDLLPHPLHSKRLLKDQTAFRVLQEAKNAREHTAENDRRPYALWHPVNNIWSRSWIWQIDNRCVLRPQAQPAQNETRVVNTRIIHHFTQRYRYALPVPETPSTTHGNELWALRPQYEHDTPHFISHPPIVLST
jgi:hypothetical protein